MGNTHPNPNRTTTVSAASIRTTTPTPTPTPIPTKEELHKFLPKIYNVEKEVWNLLHTYYPDKTSAVDLFLGLVKPGDYSGREAYAAFLKNVSLVLTGCPNANLYIKLLGNSDKRCSWYQKASTADMVGILNFYQKLLEKIDEKYRVSSEFMTSSNSYLDTSFTPQLPEKQVENPVKIFFTIVENIFRVFSRMDGGCRCERPWDMGCANAVNPYIINVQDGRVDDLVDNVLHGDVNHLNYIIEQLEKSNEDRARYCNRELVKDLLKMSVEK